VSEGADTLRKNWLASLAHERRASPHTLRAYGDDVARFIGFQAGHTGGAVTQKTLAKLSQADIRAFITARRSEGLGPGGVQRALAAVRSFYKFLAKEGILENAAARSIRTPRVRRGAR
jgi:integrase/recombinase XerC